MRAAAYKEQAQPVSAESIALILICLIDTALTIALVVFDLATEANPFLRWCLDCHVIIFYLAKTVPLVMLICVAEWYRQINPVFVKNSLRLGIAAYLSIYALSVTLINLY